MSKSLFDRAGSNRRSENDRDHSRVSAPVSEAELRVALSLIMHDSLKPITTVVGLLVFIPTVDLLFLTSQAGGRFRGWACLTLGVILIGLRLALGRRPLPPEWAHPLGGIIAGMGLLICLLTIYLVPDPNMTINFILLAIAAGSFLLSTPLLALIMIAIFIGWGSMVWMAPRSPAWRHFGISLAIGSGIAVAIHLIRVRTLRRLETLRIQNESRTAELRESETQYRTLVENSPDAIYVHRDGKVLYANPACARLIGAAHPEQFIGMSVMEVVAPESRTLVAERMRRIMQEGITLPSVEVKGMRLDGTSIEVETMGLPIIYQGQPAAQVIVRDITERKQAQEALKRSEERYRALYEDNPTMCFTVDPQGKVLSVNRFGVEKLGYAVEELVGDSVLKVFYEEDKTQAQKHFITCLQNSTKNFSWELRKARKNGSIFWVSESARATRDAGGNQVVMIICEDITERKQLEEKLRRYTEELENRVEERTAKIKELERQRAENEKLAATGRMAARIAHEINNPLGIIQNAFHLVSRAVPEAHRHHHHVNRIEKEIERIAGIVRQMLDLHRPHVEAPKEFCVDETSRIFWL